MGTGDALARACDHSERAIFVGPRLRKISPVVPANAGTHTPRPVDRAMGPVVFATTHGRGYGSRRSPGRRESYPWALIFSAAFGAKYVKTPSAPARLKASRLSIIARSPSIQPLLAAAAIIAYSPDTW